MISMGQRIDLNEIGHENILNFLEFMFHKITKLIYCTHKKNMWNWIMISMDRRNDLNGSEWNWIYTLLQQFKLICKNSHCLLLQKYVNSESQMAIVTAAIENLKIHKDAFAAVDSKFHAVFKMWKLWESRQVRVSC